MRESRTVPFVPALFVRSTPPWNESPTRANRGRAGSRRSGLATLKSAESRPNRESAVWATAMIRKVVRLSGRLNFTTALPSASVVTDGFQ